MPHPTFPPDVEFRWVDLQPTPLDERKLWPRVRVTIHPPEGTPTEEPSSYMEWSMETGEPIRGEYRAPEDAERMGRLAGDAFKWAGEAYDRWVCTQRECSQDQHLSNRAEGDK
jgi:hypothetical protein